MSRTLFLFLALFTLSQIGTVQIADAQAAEPDTNADPDDSEARLRFEAGARALDAGRYEDALQDFRRAYELSGRNALLYNVGLAAERAGETKQAEEAFAAYLQKEPNGAFAERAANRLEIIRDRKGQQPPSRDSNDSARSTDTISDDAASTVPKKETLEATNESGSGASAVSLLGASALTAGGVVALSIAVAGLASDGSCVASIGSLCSEEKRSQTGPIAIYGLIGAAAVATGVTWLVLELSGDDETESMALHLAPDSISLRGTF